MFKVLIFSSGGCKIPPQFEKPLQYTYGKNVIVDRNIKSFEELRVKYESKSFDILIDYLTISKINSLDFKSSHADIDFKIKDLKYLQFVSISDVDYFSKLLNLNQCIYVNYLKSKKKYTNTTILYDIHQEEYLGNTDSYYKLVELPKFFLKLEALLEIDRLNEIPKTPIAENGMIKWINKSSVHAITPSMYNHVQYKNFRTRERYVECIGVSVKAGFSKITTILSTLDDTSLLLSLIN